MNVLTAVDCGTRTVHHPAYEVATKVLDYSLGIVCLAGAVFLLMSLLREYRYTSVASRIAPLLLVLSLLHLGAAAIYSTEYELVGVERSRTFMRPALVFFVSLAWLTVRRRLKFVPLDFCDRICEPRAQAPESDRG